MSSTRPRSSMVLLTALSMAWMAGCGDDDDGVAPPTTGSLTVSVVTAGAPADEDGYTLTVSGTSRTVTGTSIQETFADLPIGSSSVELGDVQENCTIGGANPVSVTIPGGSNASASFDVTCAVPAVTADGVRGPFEWFGATEVDLFAGATLIHRTDGTSLFLGFEVEDPTLEANDVLRVRFDDEANGVLDASENEISLTTSRFFDLHFNGEFWARADPQAHGEGAVAAAANDTNFFEFAVPLDSGDPLDFSLTAGATLGYCVIYTKDGTATSATMFPAGCNRAGADLTRFATLVVGG